MIYVVFPKTDLKTINKPEIMIYYRANRSSDLTLRNIVFAAN